MPNIKTGQEIPCVVCGKLVYKTRAYLARGHKRITCGDFECKSKSLSGEHNPFWGKNHSQETIDRINTSKRSRPPQKKGGPPKGYKHTPEARAKITESLRNRWLNNREGMLASLAHLRLEKPIEELRYRRNFSDAQRREWREDKCRWCHSKDDLVLDHIIPVSCGGSNEKRNAQTLCRTCNLWKMAYVDRPLFLAGLDKKEG
jgi:5-methylcytosine-specific restriction endonuclease McrA